MAQDGYLIKSGIHIWTSGHAVGDVSALRKDTAGLAQLHHSISADASFLAQAEMIQAQAHAQANLEAQARAQVAVNLPALASMPDIRRLNAEQASRFYPRPDVLPQHMLPILAQSKTLPFGIEEIH